MYEMNSETLDTKFREARHGSLLSCASLVLKVVYAYYKNTKSPTKLLGLNIKKLKVINLQSHQIGYVHQGFRNLHPFFEQLDSLMVVHRNRARYLRVTHDDLNNCL